MRPSLFILIALCAALPLVSNAQYVTNIPPTQIENFEQQPDSIMVKGFGETGSISAEGGTISVRCKESNNVTINQKMYGISVALSAGQAHGSLVVDYEELDGMIRALDFLSKISYQVTPMPGFDASFTTRSGVRVGAHVDRRQSAIQLYVQFDDTEKIPLSADQFTQFENLITSAKTSLDEMRGKN
ncbi:MAG TPA: hypothetical protein VMH87_00635 [Pseudomonadales bacterium]|nr:hypothetical protein [Pseudomonadales bacterium]